MIQGITPKKIQGNAAVHFAEWIIKVLVEVGPEARNKFFTCFEIFITIGPLQLINWFSIIRSVLNEDTLIIVRNVVAKNIFFVNSLDQ